MKQRATEIESTVSDLRLALPSSSPPNQFGIFTQTDGTSFVEVLSSGEMIYLGRLPTQTVTSLWRDAKGENLNLFFLPLTTFLAS